MSKKKGYVVGWDTAPNRDLGYAEDGGPQLKGRWTPLNAGGDMGWGESFPTETASHQESPMQTDGPWVVHHQEKLPDPAVGGMPGQRKRLGWSTGFAPRSVTTGAFTGGIITAPRDLVGRSSYGPVGKDRYGTMLLKGVQAQAADFLPDTAAIARSFVSKKGAAGVSSEMTNGS